MNLLDENIPSDQRAILRAWGIRCRVIGQEIARLGIGDDNIVVLLHRLKQPILFTRDGDFFKRGLCHKGYAIVWLDLAPEECAHFIRRFLGHPRFKTYARRLGVVTRVHHDGIDFWQIHRANLQSAEWTDN